MRQFWLVLVFVTLLSLGLGCAQPPQTPDPAPVDPNPPQTEFSATLYFGAAGAEHLQAEVRTLRQGAEPVELVIVRELLLGPQTKGLVRTLPPEARLLSIQVTDGTAAVDFSRELQTKHWGGSAGELLTVYSVVNTLTEMPGIERVQFLIEGEKVESLAGHLELTEPVTRDEGYIRN